MRYARIAATGRFVPTHEVSNNALRQRFDSEFVDKMEARTGILTRYQAEPSWATSDLALPAAQQALQRAQISPDQVDLILVGTDSPDYVTPATSVVLQHKLGARRAGTFDVGCACASFPTALAAASGIIATNPAINTVLVLGVYLMQRLADPADPMIFFYGDGAGAAVVVSDDEPGILNTAFQADGSYYDRWGIFAGGTAEPATAEAVAACRTTVKMLDRYPPEINNEGWPRLVTRLAAEGGFSVSSIDFLIFTQVRRPTIEVVMETLDLPMSRTHMVMDKWGYTGSACVPMALDDALEQQKIADGALLVLVGSGVGYNQAAVAMRYDGSRGNR